MRMLKKLYPLAILVAGLILNLSYTFAKPEFTKKEKKPCTYCHTDAKGKGLNDAGKYYKGKGSLEGFKK